jgi:competence protein ComGC
VIYEKMNQSTTKAEAPCLVEHKRIASIGRLFRAKSQRTAFALIELVTVLAIIGLLVVIFLPLLTRAKATVLTVRCMNNMKELQTSYYM